MTLCTIMPAAPPVSAAGSIAPAVEAVDLTKRFDQRLVLSDVSFRIETGGFVALLGANGAGKTTLLKLLAGLQTPSSGTLRLFDEVVRANNAATRARLGIVGHASMLYRDLSAMENLVFFGRLYGVENPAARAKQLLASLDLAERGDDAVKTFSRGMMQRVSIARALMHDPSLLLADEPFTGLDAPSRDAMELMFRELNERGLTILLANHDVQQSLRIAGRLLVLRGGRVVADQRAAAVDADSVLREIRAR